MTTIKHSFGNIYFLNMDILSVHMIQHMNYYIYFLTQHMNYYDPERYRWKHHWNLHSLDLPYNVNVAAGDFRFQNIWTHIR